MFVSSQMAEVIHNRLVKDFGSSKDPIFPPGVKSPELLHSALIRCRTSLGDELKYPTAPMAAAALLHSMIHNHPFHNGNKRTGLVALLVFLDVNRWRLHADNDELFGFLLRTAAHDLIPGHDGENKPGADAEVFEMAKWLHFRMRRIQHRSPSLKWHDLKRILAKHHCKFSVRSGNRINIQRQGMQTQVWYGGDGRDIGKGMVSKIRQELQLDADHGYDDDIFYGADEGLPGFVTKYRKILDRLAKT